MSWYLEEKISQGHLYVTFSNLNVNLNLKLFKYKIEQVKILTKVTLGASETVFLFPKTVWLNFFERVVSVKMF